MATLFLAMIYSAFVSLGLPDSMLGAAWPEMVAGFAVPVESAGTAAMAALLLPLPPAAEFMKNNFFLYAMHFAWVRLINKSAALVLPHEPFFALGTFIAMPAAITALCTLFAGLGRRFCPQAYSLFSGSR